MVPSSMAVTQSAATFWPNFPQNSLLPTATEVASREWPQASWKITPPKPLSITTGMVPAGHTGAWSMVRACCAASLAMASGLILLLKISKPCMPPGDTPPVWFSVPLEAMAATFIRVYTRVSAVNSPSLLAIHTRCTLSV